VDARLAVYEHEALERAVAINQAGRMPTKHWRDAATGFTHTAFEGNRRPRGKGVLLLKLKLSSSARLASPRLSGKPRWNWRKTGKLAARG